SDHDGQLDFVVHLELLPGMPNRLARPDHGIGDLDEEPWVIEERRPRLLLDMTTVVQAAAQDLPGARNRGAQAYRIQWDRLCGRSTDPPGYRQRFAPAADQVEHSWETVSEVDETAAPRRTDAHGPILFKGVQSHLSSGQQRSDGGQAAVRHVQSARAIRRL